MSTQSMTPSLQITPHRRRYGALTRMRVAGHNEVRARLQGLLRALPEEAGEVRDEQDNVDRHIERELDFALLAMQSRMLRGIDLALERVRQGEGTDCSDCGAGIGAARLRALPFATRCRHCQEQFETVVSV
jgi:DnaK suppressor protein